MKMPLGLNKQTDWIAGLMFLFQIHIVIVHVLHSYLSADRTLQRI